MTAFDAFLGRVWNQGNELELQGGVDFRSGLRAVANTALKRIEIHSTYEAASILVGVGESISDALAAASAAGGGKVILDVGTHTIAGALTVPAGVILAGVSRYSTTLSTDSEVLFPYNGSGLADLRLESSDTAYAVYVTGDHVTFERCHVVSTAASTRTIYVNAVDYFTVRDLEITSQVLTDSNSVFEANGSCAHMRLDQVLNNGGASSAGRTRLNADVTGAMILGWVELGNGGVEIYGDRSTIIGLDTTDLRLDGDTNTLVGCTISDDCDIGGNDNDITGLRLTSATGDFDVTGERNAISGTAVDSDGRERALTSVGGRLVAERLANNTAVAAGASYVNLITLPAGFIGDGEVRTIDFRVVYGTQAGAASTQESDVVTVVVTRSGATASTANYSLAVGTDSDGPSTTPAVTPTLVTPTGLEVQVSMASGALSVKLAQDGTARYGRALLVRSETAILTTSTGG